MSVILVFSASASTSDSLVGAEPEPLPVTHLGSRVVLKYEEGLLKDGGSRLKGFRIQTAWVSPCLCCLLLCDFEPIADLLWASSQPLTGTDYGHLLYGLVVGLNECY